MLMSGREAAAVLARKGLTREPARRLLLAGFAGPAVRLRGVLLYEADRVEELADRQPVTFEEWIRACPRGAFVLRTWRDVDVQAPIEEQLERLRLCWWLSIPARILIAESVHRDGFHPLLVTVSGHVAVAGEIVGLQRVSQRRTQLLVRPAGAWQEALLGRQVDLGLAGPWQLWSTWFTDEATSVVDHRSWSSRVAGREQSRPSHH